MFHQSFFADTQLKIRSDLRAAALHDWETIDQEPGYVWRSAGPIEGVAPDSAATKMAGLVSSIAVDPSTISGTNRLTVGTAGGGIWRSLDDGATWSALGDGLPSLQTVSVSVTERGADPPLLVAGTGGLNEERLRRGALAGAFRSVDGGQTWSTLDGGPDATIFRSHDVNQIFALDDSKLVVATRVGLYFSKDGGRNFGLGPDHNDGRPILRGHVTAMVRDGTNIGFVVSGESPPAIDPRPPELSWQLAPAAAEPGLWLAPLTADGLGAATLAHATRATATDRDVGNTRLAQSGRFWMISVGKLNIPRDTFAEINLLRGTNPHHSIQITRRDPTNAGAWGSLRTSDVSPAQALYSHEIALEPTGSSSSVKGWFGTVDLFRTQARVSGAPARWRWQSTDEKGTDSDAVHVDQHAILVLTRSPGTFRTWVGNDGGLFQTNDAGSHWTAHNSHDTLLVWTIALARKDASTARLVIGTQDNGTFVGEGPFEPPLPTDYTWEKVGPGDGGGCAWVPRAIDRQPWDDPQEALYTANGLLLVAAGTSIGNWAALPTTVDTAPFAAGFEVGGPPRPNNAFVPQGFIYSETVTLARGTGGEWNRTYFGRSEARNGVGWLFRREGAPTTAPAPAGTAPRTVPVSASPTPSATVLGQGSPMSAMITATAAAPADVATETASPPGAWDQLWIGLADGKLFFSSDAGDTVSPVPIPGALPLPIGGIAVDPQNSARVVVVFAGFSETPRRLSSKKVFLTENRGATWRDISGTRAGSGFVPDIPVLGVRFARTTPTALLISTELGVMITKDLGTTWRRLSLGTPKVSCSAIDILNPEPSAGPRVLNNDGLPPVAVATFGRGVFMLARPGAAEATIEFDGGFGAVKTGTTVRRKLTVHNVGNNNGATLVLSTITASGDFSFAPIPPATGNIAAPISINPGESSSWFVVCSPGTAGIKTATLTIGPLSVPVSCEAFDTGVPRLAVWPKQVNLGSVAAGSTAEETVHLSNRGQSDLVIQRITAVGTPPAELTLQGDGFDVSPASPPAKTLAPGESATFRVRYAPTTEGTAHQASWRVECNDPVHHDGHRTIAARGVAGSASGTPDWVPWVIAGAVVVAVAVGIGIGVAVAQSGDDG